MTSPLAYPHRTAPPSTAPLPPSRALALILIHVVVDQNYDSRIYGNQRGVRLDDGNPIIRDSLIELVALNGEGLSSQLDTNGATAERVQVDLYGPETAIRATGTNPSVRDAVVNMYGFDDVGRVLSNVSRDAVALNTVST